MIVLFFVLFFQSIHVNHHIKLISFVTKFIDQRAYKMFIDKVKKNTAQNPYFIANNYLRIVYIDFRGLNNI